MSINTWIHREWGRPPQYVDSEQPRDQGRAQPGERTAEETEALARGESLGRDRELMPTEFGDGRPDPNLADREPMVYRQGSRDRQPVLDVDDDKDFVDSEGPQPDYVPAARTQPRPAHQVAAQPKPLQSLPQKQPQDGVLIYILGIHPQGGGDTLVSANINGVECRMHIDEMERHSKTFAAWAQAAKAVKL